MTNFSMTSQDRDEYTDEQDFEYQLLIVDSDTPVFNAANLQQESYIVVTHKDTGWSQEFKNVTAFYGRGKDKNKGWIGEQNAKRDEDKQISWKDFEIEKKVRLLEDVEDHVEAGVQYFDMFIGGIKSLKLAPDYKLLVGGEGNYRYDQAETQPYKGNRTDKPLLFQEIKDAILTKYKNKVEVADGREADDLCAVYGAKNAKHFLKTDEWLYCLAYVDKDLKMIFSPYVNYERKEDGVTIPTQLECAKCYGKQLLCGDKSTDFIPGLPNIPNDLREKYGIRKGSSVGDTTAINYLKTCETIKEVFERVVEAYRGYYGEDTFEFESFRGDKYQCDWIDRLNETAILVYMNPLDDPLQYDIRQTLDRLEIDYA